MNASTATHDEKELPRRQCDRISRTLGASMVTAHDKLQKITHRNAPDKILEWGRRYLANHFAQPASAMHEWLGEQLDQLREHSGRKINVIGPRGSAKSTIATLCYVLRAAVEKWDPYIWIVSDTKEQAQLHLENVKAELEGNALLREDYPNAVEQGDHWRATSVVLSNGVVIESYGTGQSIRGRRHSADRPSLIICDDLQNDSHIESPDQRQSTRQWFQGTLLNAGTKRTNFVNLATALHRDALALELHRGGGWTSKTFPAIVSWPTNMGLWAEWEKIYCEVQNPRALRAAEEFYERNYELMDAGAAVLWPAVEDLYTLMQIRTQIGHTAFEREKQGSPTNPEFCEWPDAYFDEHIWFDTWPADLRVRTIALDPSKGHDSGRGDYSAYVLLGIDARGMIYVDADLARRPTPQMVADGVALCERFRPDAFAVEANQYQELLCNEFASEFARRGIHHITPLAIHNHTSKLMRIRKIGRWLSQRKMRFLTKSAGTRKLVDQLRDFPAGTHDDGPDALEMALRLAEIILTGRQTNDGLGNRLVAI